MAIARTMVSTLFEKEYGKFHHKRKLFKHKTKRVIDTGKCVIISRNYIICLRFVSRKHGKSNDKNIIKPMDIA